MAGSPGPSFFERHDNVYLYVPNLIGVGIPLFSGHTVSELRPSRPTPPSLAHSYPPGYARIAFALYGFAVASTSPGAMVLSYALSFVCDELDGRFARMLNQTSTLGQVLDMVTDRCDSVFTMSCDRQNGSLRGRKGCVHGRQSMQLCRTL